MPQHKTVIEVTNLFDHDLPMNRIGNLTRKLKEKGLKLLVIPPARKNHPGSSKPEMRLYQIRERILSMCEKKNL